MWLQLTTIEDIQIRINFKFVECYGRNDQNTFIETSSGKYYVKEAPTAIDALLSKQQEWK